MQFQKSLKLNALYWQPAGNDYLTLKNLVQMIGNMALDTMQINVHINYKQYI